MSHNYSNNSLSIGNTPLIQTNRISDGNIFAKVESRNPAGSVKCRIAANMISEAEKNGSLKKGMTIIEATSGNTGVGLSFVAAAKGYPLVITMPSSMSLERRQLMKALGATLILTEPAKGMPGAIAKAKEIVAENPATYFMPEQFENPANPGIHEATTGPEIWNDTEGKVDIVVSGVGTGGTLTGVARYLKNTQKKAITMVAVEPEASNAITAAITGVALVHGPHKIQGIGAGFVPTNLDLSVIDQVEQVSNEDAIAWAHRLMREEGILAGISSGAAMAAAYRVSQQPQHKGKTIVVILPDSGERYLSTPLFEGVFSDNETKQ